MYFTHRVVLWDIKLQMVKRTLCCFIFVLLYHCQTLFLNKDDAAEPEKVVFIPRYLQCSSTSDSSAGDLVVLLAVNVLCSRDEE